MIKFLTKYFGLISFYLVVIGGVCLIDARFEKLNKLENQNIIAFDK